MVYYPKCVFCRIINSLTIYSSRSAPFEQADLNNSTGSPKRRRASKKSTATSGGVTLATSQSAKRDQLFKAADDDIKAVVRAVCETLNKEDLLEPQWREAKTERTVLHASLEKYSVEVANWLVNWGGKELVQEMYKITIGARTGKQTTLHALVQAADMQDPERLGLLKKIIRHTSGGFLRRQNDQEMLNDFTIRLDPDLDGRARHFTALHIAAYRGDIEVVKTLVEASASINSSHNRGPTPIFYAIRYGHYKVVETLIKLGADVDFQTQNGSTPLYWAVRYEQSRIVTLLLHKGANINKPRSQGFGLPLILAAALGNSDIIHVLLNKGADKNSKNTNSRTALHFVAAMGHTDLIHQLDGSSFSLVDPMLKMIKAINPLEYNVTDKLGSTPLMFAVKGGYDKTAEALLNMKADITAVNVLKQSVWHFALQHNDKTDQVINKKQNNVNPEINIFLNCHEPRPIAVYG